MSILTTRPFTKYIHSITARMLGKRTVTAILHEGTLAKFEGEYGIDIVRLASSAFKGEDGALLHTGLTIYLTTQDLRDLADAIDELAEQEQRERQR